jgi:hypothetical protein
VDRVHKLMASLLALVLQILEVIGRWADRLRSRGLRLLAVPDYLALLLLELIFSVCLSSLPLLISLKLLKRRIKRLLQQLELQVFLL